MPEITDREALIVLDLLKMAWNNGAIRNEALSEEAKVLRSKLESEEKRKPLPAITKKPSNGRVLPFEEEK